jgi:hypothetical protein
MSIKLMAAIFETEIFDLTYTKNGQDHKAKASTVKIMLLALADHANDYGESSYPGYSKLEKKTCLSRQGISDTLEALKYNGLITVSDEPSRIGTNDYTINIRAFPGMAEEAASLPELVKPLDQGSQATLLPLVKPLDYNHHSTIIQPDIYKPPSKKIKPPPKTPEPPDPVIQAMTAQGMFTNPQTADYLRDWRKVHPDERIIQAIEKSAGTNQKYVDTMLLGWDANGYPPTREERIAAARKGKDNGNSNNPGRNQVKQPEITNADRAVAREILSRQSAPAASP